MIYQRKGGLRFLAFIFFSMCSFFHTTESIVEAKYFKGLASCLKSEFVDYSPLNGVVFYESGFLKNFLKYGPEELPTHTLMELLFSIHPSDDRFSCTKQKSKVAYGIGVKEVGILLRSLYFNDGDLSSAIKVKKQIIELLKEGHTEQLVKNKEHQSMKSKDFASFIITVEDSYKTDKLITIGILLGFLYAKAEKKEQLIDYLYAFSDAADEKIFSEKNESKLGRKNVFCDGTGETAEENGQSFELKDSFYTDEELSSFEAFISHTSCGDLYMFDIEKTLRLQIGVSYLCTKIQLKKYPPYILTKSYSFNNQNLTANCMEAALQDFFNNFFFNNETLQFDFSLVSLEIQGSLLPAFKTFYEDQQLSTEKVNDPIVGQAWMDLVSNIDGVNYFRGNGLNEKGRYELNPDVGNVLKVMNYLLGVNDLSFEKLGAILSTETRTVSFTQKSKEESGTLIDIIQCSVSSSLGEKSELRTLQIKISKNKHGWIRVIGRDGVNEGNLIYQNKMTYKDLLPREFFFNEQFYKYYLYDFSNPTGLSNVVEALLGNIFVMDDFTHEKRLIDMADEDKKIYEHFLEVIVKNGEGLFLETKERICTLLAFLNIGKDSELLQNFFISVMPLYIEKEYIIGSKRILLRDIDGSELKIELSRLNALLQYKPEIFREYKNGHNKSLLQLAKKHNCHKSFIEALMAIGCTD